MAEKNLNKIRAIVQRHVEEMTCDLMKGGFISTWTEDDDEVLAEAVSQTIRLAIQFCETTEEINS